MAAPIERGNDSWNAHGVAGQVIEQIRFPGQARRRAPGPADNDPAGTEPAFGDQVAVPAAEGSDHLKRTPRRQ
jgi:hypothetical protein